MTSSELAEIRAVVVSIVELGNDLNQLRGENKALREEVIFLRGALNRQPSRDNEGV